MYENCLCALCSIFYLEFVRCVIVLPFCIRESGRVVLIPFQPPRLGPEQIDDTELLCRCRDAGDAVPIFIKLGKLFEEADRAAVDKRVENEMDVTVRIRRTYMILLLFSLKVSNYS